MRARAGWVLQWHLLFPTDSQSLLPLASTLCLTPISVPLPHHCFVPSPICVPPHLYPLPHHLYTYLPTFQPTSQPSSPSLVLLSSNLPPIPVLLPSLCFNLCPPSLYLCCFSPISATVPQSLVYTSLSFLPHFCPLSLTCLPSPSPPPPRWLEPHIHSNHCCCGSWHLLPHPMGWYFWHRFYFIFGVDFYSLSEHYTEGAEGSMQGGLCSGGTLPEGLPGGSVDMDPFP